MELYLHAYWFSQSSKARKPWPASLPLKLQIYDTFCKQEEWQVLSSPAISVFLNRP